MEFFNRVSELVPDLRRAAVGYIEKTEMDEVIDIMTELTEACALKGQPEVNHPANQAILINAETLDVLFDMLHLEKQATEVVAATFERMRAMCVNQPSVKALVYAKLDRFLTYDANGDGWQNAFGTCFAEVFEANQDICLRVTTAQIEALINLVGKHGVDARGILDALMAVVFLEDANAPLQRNQFLIVKTILHHKKNFFLNTAGVFGTAEKRSAVLRQGQGQVLAASRCRPADLSGFIHHRRTRTGRSLTLCSSSFRCWPCAPRARTTSSSRCASRSLICRRSVRSC